MPDWLVGWLSDIFSRVVATKTALPVFLVTSFVLFAPDAFLETIGLERAAGDYALPLGVFFVLSGAILVSNFAIAAGNLFFPMMRDWLFIQTNKGAFKKLTAAEKEALRPFIIDGEASVTFPYSDGVANLLSSKKIIFRPSSLAVYGDRFSFVMQPWAREYLEKNKHLLD